MAVNDQIILIHIIVKIHVSILCCIQLALNVTYTV